MDEIDNELRKCAWNEPFVEWLESEYNYWVSIAEDPSRDPKLRNDAERYAVVYYNIAEEARRVVASG